MWHCFRRRVPFHTLQVASHVDHEKSSVLIVMMLCLAARSPAIITFCTIIFLTMLVGLCSLQVAQYLNDIPLVRLKD